MDTTGYEFWDTEEAFDPAVAAQLWLGDADPHTDAITHLKPSVKVFARRIIARFGLTESVASAVIKTRVAKRTGSEMPKTRVSRAQLIILSEELNQRPAFLYPEERDLKPCLSATKKKRLRHDTESHYQFIVGLLIHTLTDKHPNLGKPNDAGPNQSRIIDELKKTAEKLDVSTEGLSDSQLNDRLAASLLEVKDRKREI